MVASFIQEGFSRNDWVKKAVFPTYWFVDEVLYLLSDLVCTVALGRRWHYLHFVD